MIKNKITKKNNYQNLINQINELEDDLKTLSNNELKAKSVNLKKQYETTQNLNSLIPQSFALTREASKRTLGLRHFNVQLIGGLVLNDTKIAEMRTGEGKTLVATLPAFLNGLTKKGVHIVTVNNYLANRDQISMGQIYRFLGLNTGLIQDDMRISERRINYNADITYVTNYEVTFDYLRDNMALNLEDITLRPFNYCIIDEVDSILIDEAQTPLIISNNLETPVEKYIFAAEIAKYLESDNHYKIDAKNRNILLTETGNVRIEEIIRTQTLYDPNDPWIPYVINAIKANSLYTNNINYIIQDNRIVIVDEFTGRLMPDRRWGDGLHQAIEAKENLPIRKKTETIALITYQNFFLLYPKLAGMTGTGKTAEIEFKKIYNLAVEEIPTAKPIQRQDLPDLVYKDQFSKWNAITHTCRKIYKKKQPILIGTTTVKKSEMLAQLFNEYQLPYQVLNAKPENVRRESEIVAQAGRRESITIATNMEGRGTDIILGGNVKFKIQKKLYDILTVARKIGVSDTKFILNFIIRNQFQVSSQKFLSVLLSLLNDKPFFLLSDLRIFQMIRNNKRIELPIISYNHSISFLISDYCDNDTKKQQQENKIIKNLGGLYIVGTERNNSRRVDNQLRGRCGRQGDPGISRFFLSLDDKLLRIFGNLNLKNFMKTQILDDLPLEGKMITKTLTKAQERVEEYAYQQRKSLFDYDDILNQQRNIIYYERKQVLESRSFRDTILAYAEQTILDTFLECSKYQKRKRQISISKITSVIENLFGQKLMLNHMTNEDIRNNFDAYELKTYLFNEFWLIYQAKITEFSVYGEGICDTIERTIILINRDQFWKEHLQKTLLLKETIVWRQYGQRNPLYEYKKAAFNLFKNREKQLKTLIIYDLLRSSIS